MASAIARLTMCRRRLATAVRKQRQQRSNDADILNLETPHEIFFVTVAVVTC
jgi:hypothetical protein